MNKKGFTLVEVLVVIAIIGILASVVLASLNESQKDSSSNPDVVQNTDIFPEPTNYAVDTTGTISVEDLAILNAQLKALDTDKHQFAVAIVKTTSPYDIEQYGIKLAEKWRVGKAGLDNGAIVIIATEDRKVRLEIGYGLEGDINDAKAGEIIDNDMVPFLKEGKWASAASAGITSISTRVK
jgi:uncharacterized protein